MKCLYPAVKTQHSQSGASLVAQLVKNLPAMRETWVWSLGWEDPLEKGTATHSSVLVFWPGEFHGLYSPWNSPGQNSGVGSRSLLQGIFLTQESNWGLLQCRQILYQLSYHTYKQSSLNLAQSLNELKGFTLTLSRKGKINPDRKMKNHPQLLISYKQCLAFGQTTRLVK